MKTLTYTLDDFCNTEIEQKVLSDLLQNYALQDKYFRLIPVSYFVDSRNQLIYKTCSKLKASEGMFNLDLLVNEMKMQKRLQSVGGIVYLAEIMEKSQGFEMELVANIGVLRELTMKRELIVACNQALTQLSTGKESEEILNTLQAHISSVKVENYNRQFTTLQQAMEDVIQRIDKNFDSETEITGIRTGIEKFDNFTGGLQKDDLFVIAAQSSQGKTSLALSIAIASALHGTRVAYYTMEMSSLRIAARLLAMSAEYGISVGTILNKRLSLRQRDLVIEAKEKLQNAQIFFDDTSTNKIDDIIAGIESLHGKIDLAVVDHLGLIQLENRNTEQALGDAANRLKALSRQYGITIIALCQLNRDNSDPYQEPTARRIRNSGRIFEAADIVATIYRPEYYGLKTYHDDESMSVEGTARIRIEKGRDVGQFQFYLGFNGEKMRFYNLGTNEKVIKVMNNIPSSEVEDKINGNQTERMMPNINFYEKDNENDEAF